MTSIDTDQMLFLAPSTHMEVFLESSESLTTGIKAAGPIDAKMTEFSKEVWKRIELLYDFAENTGGVAYDSESEIHKESLYSARQFLLSLPESFPLPKLSPEGEGGVMFLWETGLRTTIMIIEGSVFHLVRDAGTNNAQYFDNIPLQEIPPKELVDSVSE